MGVAHGIVLAAIAVGTAAAGALFRAITGA